MAEELSFEDELIRAVNADPFIPFTVVMCSGDRYEVTSPMQIALGSDLLFIFRAKSKGGSAYCRIYNVSSIELAEPAK
jgi:hypothetical protein